MATHQQLVSKYSKQAPRYTSYPSALHFEEEDNPERALAHIDSHNDSPRHLSLYIHIPFCESLCWYCGCTKVITRRPGASGAYLLRLFREMERIRQKIHPGNKVVQIHFGGGTPTYLSADELRKAGEKLQDFFSIDENPEFSVEVDPRCLTEDHASALADIGCNRTSVGIQDIHENVQNAVNRIQPWTIIEKAFERLHAAGIPHINVDLIYGLPFQTTKSFEVTLEEVKKLDPDRFAIFNYAHVPWMMPSQKLLDRYPMPGPSEKLSMLKIMIANLTASGYAFIGMDHFAKNGDELTLAQKSGTLQRNFQGYSTRADCDIYGFGMSSISQIGNGYLQSVKDLNDYYRRIDNDEPPYFKRYQLTRDDQIRRDTIMRLMCDLKLDFHAIGTRWNIDAMEYFSDATNTLNEMETDGLLTRNGQQLRVTDTGRMFLRNIATAFDAYLAKSTNRKRYSKTV